jgi:hypothetical protein
MLLKPLKLKMRNPVYTYEQFSDNDNYFRFEVDFNHWGFGINYRLGDSRRFFVLDLLFLHLEIWF